MGAAIAAAAIAAGGAVYGAQQNKKAGEANANMAAESKDDYKTRLKAAAKWAGTLEKQYNKIVAERPNLTWDTYVKEQMKQIDDPRIRQFYLNAKQQDFEVLRNLAKHASEDNVDNLVAAADDISGGRWQENLAKSYDLIESTNAGARLARAHELSAPLLGDASTVRYDEKGQLIQGQRADKQLFNTAYETEVAAQREQKEDRRAFSNDILSAAQSQTQKASDFTQFFDPTGFATALSQQQQAQNNSYQLLDEQRGFSLFEKFAAASAGITPVQPQYQSANPGDAMIAAGLQQGASSLTDYYRQNAKPTSTDVYGNKATNITGAKGSGSSAPKAIPY